MSVEIGSYLRQARESIGLSLEQLQEHTKVQKSFLIAIENGEFHKLPSPFYVRSYLRSYANQVKVEPHHILRQYRKEEQAERYQTGQYQVKQLEEQVKQTRRLSPQNTGRMSVITGLDLTNPQVNKNSALTVAVSSQNSQKQPKAELRTQRTDKSSALSVGTSKQNTGSSKVKEKNLQYSNRRTEKEKSSLPSQTRPQRVVSQLDTQPTLSKTNPGQTTRPTLDKEIGVKDKELTTLSRQQTASSSNELVAAETAASTGLSRVSRYRKETDPSESASTTSRRRSGSNQNTSFMTGLLKNKVVLLIGLAVVVFGISWFFIPGEAEQQPDNHTNSAAPSADESTTNDNANASQPAPEEDQSNGDATASLQNAGSGHYILKNSDQAEIKFTATQGNAWIQIRKTKTASGEYLKDFTLSADNGASYEYQHTYAEGEKDLYISIGTPSSVDVTVNGTQVDAVKLLHIEKQ